METSINNHTFVKYFMNEKWNAKKDDIRNFQPDNFQLFISLIRGGYQLSWKQKFKKKVALK